MTFSRSEWIKACHFHDLSETAVLDEVAKRVRKVGPEGKPIVLLDLDSTLYEVAPRTHQILKEWVRTHESQAFPSVIQALEKLEHLHVGYSLKDTFSAIGLSLMHDSSEAN